MHSIFFYYGKFPTARVLFRPYYFPPTYFLPCPTVKLVHHVTVEEGAGTDTAGGDIRATVRPWYATIPRARDIFPWFIVDSSTASIPIVLRMGGSDECVPKLAEDARRSFSNAPPSVQAARIAE